MSLWELLPQSKLTKDGRKPTRIHNKNIATTAGYSIKQEGRFHIHKYQIGLPLFRRNYYVVIFAGNGTIGLEILEDLPEVDTIVAPFGGGGLSCGIASVMKAEKPDVKVFVSELTCAAPVQMALKARKPLEVMNHSTVQLKY